MTNTARMSCKEIFEMLSQYLDRELPAEVCDCMETHIEACPPCVEFVQTLEKTVRICRTMQAQRKPAAIPPELREELLAAYQRSVR
ncbi:MAG: zf-HC2 domain-containing protein [Bryobacterales bacterium]|nr:zf-HC2 domain-containing protein [Bryobacterales bacterium]